MKEITEFIQSLLATYTPVPDVDILFKPRHDTIGICPRCGSDVMEYDKGFFCSNKKCTFALWKNNKFFADKDKPLDKDIAVGLLKEGKIHLDKMLSKKSILYSADVIMTDDGEHISFKLLFQNE